MFISAFSISKIFPGDDMHIHEKSEFLGPYKDVWGSGGIAHPLFTSFADDEWSGSRPSHFNLREESPNPCSTAVIFVRVPPHVISVQLCTTKAVGV
jgi:hypothetical protein